jgi:hypothetical protein
MATRRRSLNSVILRAGEPFILVGRGLPAGGTAGIDPEGWLAEAEGLVFWATFAHISGCSQGSHRGSSRSVRALVSANSGTSVATAAPSIFCSPGRGPKKSLQPLENPPVAQYDSCCLHLTPEKRSNNSRFGLTLPERVRGSGERRRACRVRVRSRAFPGRSCDYGIDGAVGTGAGPSTEMHPSGPRAH